MEFLEIKRENDTTLINIDSITAITQEQDGVTIYYKPDCNIYLVRGTFKVAYRVNGRNLAKLLK